MRTRDRVRQLNKRIGEQIWMEPTTQDGKVVLVIASNKGLHGVIQDEAIDAFLDECEGLQRNGVRLADMEVYSRAFAGQL